MTGVVVLILRIATAIALLGFLGWSFVTIWRELREQLGTLSNRQIPPIEISWEEGSQVESHLYSIPELIIGRDPQCDCPIPNETISARHARLTYHHNHWWLEDLISTNGTFINQERVDVPTVLATGDEVRCGQVDLLISIEENS